MKKNYILSLLFVFFGFCSNVLQAQQPYGGTADYGSAPAAPFPAVVIQDILENDLFNGLPITISDVTISQVSSSSNYLTLDTTTGSVLYVNGPAPVGNYYIAYNIVSNATQQTSFARRQQGGERRLPPACPR